MPLAVASSSAFVVIQVNRARRVAEVSRFKDFKDCDVIGSKDKVCL